MEQQDDPPCGDTAAVRFAKRIDKAKRITVKTARQVCSDASAKGSQILLSGQKAALKKLGGVQSALGEDYQQIFADNPLVIDSLSRAPLLIDNKQLLSTAFNLPWMTTALWSAAAGTVVEFQRPISHALGGVFHYGPGHVRRWAEVNQYMDSVAGSGHRLKFGHTVDFLPRIYERFGIEGVPAFFLHLLQDFFTPDGLPLLPNAWAIKRHLAIAGLAPKMTTALVSLSASNVLAGAMIVATVFKTWDKLDRNKRKLKLLGDADSAAESGDYSGAVENYKRALELERAPATLIALGQVYLRRAQGRPYAHRCFTDAVQVLSTDISGTVPYRWAQLSLRGIAGLHALATADVIGDSYPQYWQEQVQDLVNATVHSFVSAADKLEHSAPRIANSMVRPPLFSAAINRYLAAQSACQYPLLEDRQQLVTTHIRKAVGLVGRVAQRDESSLRESANQLRGVWTRTVLPEKEADLLLSTA
jgi:tetratricopeptide (TPR) repeat protein